MDYSIIIALVLFSIGWCKNGTLISINGCFKGSELRDDEKNNSIFIEQNYPGLCLQTCIHQKRTHPVAVALKDTSCLCLNRTKTKNEPETSTRNCTETCPGHDELYCGHRTLNCYSSYLISKNAIDPIDEEQCAAHMKGSQLTMHNCSNSHPTFCYVPAGPKFCDELSTSANWSHKLLECTGLGRLGVQYYTMGNNTESDACPNGFDIRLGSYYGITPTFWIPSFGQNAPTVPCPKLMEPAHGKITFTANPRIAVYSCESSFELTPNGTRFCLANRTWNGTTPICQKLVITTHITATSAETTADTTTQTVTSDMPIDATTSSLVSEITTTTLVSETTTSSSSSRFPSSTASSNSTVLITSPRSTETRSPMAKSAGSSSDSNIGLIVGIVFGVVVSCIIAFVVIWCKAKEGLCRRNNKVSPSKEENIGNEEEDVQANTSNETHDNDEISVTIEHANDKSHEQLTQERDGERRNSSSVTRENNESGGKVVSVKEACNNDKDHEQLTLGKDDENRNN